MNAVFEADKALGRMAKDVSAERKTPIGRESAGGPI